MGFGGPISISFLGLMVAVTLASHAPVIIVAIMYYACIWSLVCSLLHEFLVSIF